MLITPEFVAILLQALGQFHITETVDHRTPRAVRIGGLRICTYDEGRPAFIVEDRTGRVLNASDASLPLTAIMAVVEFYRDAKAIPALSPPDPRQLLLAFTA